MSTADWTKPGAGGEGSPPTPAPPPLPLPSPSTPTDDRGGRPREGEPAVADGFMPLWALSLSWELRRGRQVILNGQIRDRWWFDGSSASFREVVARTLVQYGSQVVGWWNPVGGLDFPVPEHAEHFDRLVAALPRRSAPGSGRPDGQGQRTSADGAEERPTEGGGPEESRTGEDASGSTSRGAERRRSREGLFTRRPPGRPQSFDDVVETVRRLAASPESATAFVFEDVDHQLPPGQPESHLGYLRLRAAMTDAVTPHSAEGSRPPARNAVLCAVGEVGRLPGWFHLEDPRIVALHIGPPDPSERRLWLTWLLQRFNGAPDASRADLEALVSATDGMTGWDIESLARTSWLRNAPVQKPDKLLELHRLNVSVDPWTQLDRGTISRAVDVLATRVVGQSTAVNAVASALQSAFVGVDFGHSGTARPRGAFFFVGPTGVGKTELAKAVAELMFGDQSAYARFDMSEYQQEHAAERLAGAPPGYIGYEQGGELTRRVQERPFSVLLFDEIEKAHPKVLDKFLQVLEDGRLTDGRGQTAYFSECLIIFTSNTGAEELQDLLERGDGEVPYAELESHFTGAVEEKFRQIGRPEIYGRLKPGVVVFDMLRREHIVRIADRLLGQLSESVRERHRVELVHDTETLHPWITERMSEPEHQAYGGRQIRNELERVRTAVVGHLLEHRPGPGSRIRAAAGPDGAVLVTAEGGGAT